MYHCEFVGGPFDGHTEWRTNKDHAIFMVKIDGTVLFNNAIPTPRHIYVIESESNEGPIPNLKYRFGKTEKNCG